MGKKEQSEDSLKINRLIMINAIIQTLPDLDDARLRNVYYVVLYISK